MVNAIVLAGDTGYSEGSLVKNVNNKAFIKLGQKYMVQYIIGSLRHAKCVGKIVVVGPERRLKDAVGDCVDAVLQSEGSIMSNMKKGIAFLSDENCVIICTSDIPLVSSDAIDDFIAQCCDKNIDVGYPIIEKSLNDAKYPEVKRTYVKMKEGIYTGGNIVYINPLIIENCYNAAEYLVKNRKNALKMARILGITILVRLALGILKIKTAEKRVNKLFGINAKAIFTTYPEIGNDVDKIDDVNFVNKYLNIGL